MTGRMIDLDANGSTAPGYLATPDAAAGPGVVVLHEWWGLTEPIRQACDRLAEAGFVALAPDLYRGKTTAKVEEADALGSALDQQVEKWRGGIRGGGGDLRQKDATLPRHGRRAALFSPFPPGATLSLRQTSHTTHSVSPHPASLSS